MSSRKVHFQPWRGQSYDKGIFGVKLLILGEAHYGGPSKDFSNFTNEVIQEVIDGENRQRFFERVRSVVVGPDSTEWNRERFWNAVAYYNYVQELIPAARVRPTNDAFTNGDQPFKDVLNSLTPDCVLVLGKTLWQSLPGGEECKELPVSKKVREHSIAGEMCVYALPGGHRLLAGMVPHPSSFGFRSDFWGPWVGALLASTTIIAGT
jgi:hypothetical protein